MSEASPTTELRELLDASASGSRGQRLEALHKLSGARGPFKDPRLAAGLSGLQPTDPEAVLRLELLARGHDPAARRAALGWISALLGAPRPRAEELPSWRRALVPAAKLIAEAEDPSADAALLALASLGDSSVAGAALAALDARPSFPAPQHLLELAALLAATFDLEAQTHVLSLLGRTRSPDAIPLVLESMERWAEANPGQGAAAHAAALRALTGQALGDHPAAWRAWRDAQKSGH
ncbi:MAG: hypothetical protein U1E65_21560 [Myxococcota bacterium]